MSSVFAGMAIIMVIVFVISLIVAKIKQPLIIGYILSGILVGPLFFNIMGSAEGYEAFAHIGVALLLFIVGLHLNLKLAKEVGLISLVVGMAQIIGSALIGFGISYFLGFSFMVSMIIGIGLTFSSTIVIVKVLSDKRDLDKTYGRISVGVLLVQDLVAILLLMILSSIINLDGDLGTTLITTILFGIIAAAVVFIFAKAVLPSLLDYATKIKELLFLFIISWCFGISVLFEFIGFSLEIGALLAGITLASTNYQHDISSRIKPLRDFFIVLFFVFLGSQMIATVPAAGTTLLEKLAVLGSSLQPILFEAILLSVIIIITKPIITFLLVIPFGYSSKAAFKSGVTLSQISEFSLILLLMAKEASLIGDDIISLITIITVITITVSSYFIVHADSIYKRVGPFLRQFEKKKIKDSLHGVQGKPHEILIFGFSRVGMGLINSIKQLNKNYLVVDHNPELIKKLSKKEIPCVYGDIGNVEFIAECNMSNVHLLISTVEDFAENNLLLNKAREDNKNATIILSASTIEDALELYERGADYVILPHVLGGHYVSTLIEDFKGDTERFLTERILHLDQLKERKHFSH